MTGTRPRPLPEAEAAPRPGTATTALFVVYLALLGWVVLWKLETPWVGTAAQRVVKLVPFAADGGAGASDPSEVLANLVLFVPLGLYLGLLAPSWPWWKAVGAIAGTSLALEAAQYALAVGRSDVTDLVVNTAGGVVGLALHALARRTLRARATAVVTRACVAVTVLALLASALVVASPLRYAPPGDAPGPHRTLPAQDAGTSMRDDAPG